MTEKTKKTNTPKTSTPKTSGKSGRTTEPKSAERVAEKQTSSETAVAENTTSQRTVAPRTVARSTVARTSAGRADSESAATDGRLTMTMPETDELDNSGAPKKRPVKKSTTRIITKDSEYDGSMRAYSGNAKIDQSVIDDSVFDDDVTEEPISGYYHKSMTIDDTMLSREAADARRKSGKRRKQRTKRITATQRNCRHSSIPCLGSRGKNAARVRMMTPFLPAVKDTWQKYRTASCC